MDEYEREHFRGQGRVLYRDKVKIHRSAAAVIVCLAVGFLITALAGLINGTAPLVIMGLLFGLPILAIVPLFGVIRLLVTDREFRMQVGLGGPRVNIDDIVKCVVLEPGFVGTRGAKELILVHGSVHALELHLADARVLRLKTTAAQVGALATAIEEARRTRTPSEHVHGEAESSQNTRTSSQTEHEAKQTQRG